MDYDAYVALFNVGDDRRLIETFYHDDITFTGASRIYHGKDELIGFLAWAHDGVREIIREQTVLRDDNKIFAEIDMDFIATKVRPDFPFGALRPGDICTVKFFVLYTLMDNKIIDLKSMNWSPEHGVTKTPPLGTHPGQRAAYFAYAQAFSDGDMERAGRYYTEDCTLDLSSLPLIEGRQAIIDFYRRMFQQVRETLTVHSLVIDDGGIAGDLTSTFTAIEDAPDFVVGPLRKGEAITVRVFVHYTLRDGLISRIKVARAGDPERRKRPSAREV